MFDTDFAREYLGQDPPGESLLGAKQFFDNRDEAYTRQQCQGIIKGKRVFFRSLKSLSNLAKPIMIMTRRITLRHT